ncbi:MAG: S1 RNA-binding domain-containing protein [Candidatus Paceibacterota bacterium]
MRQPRFSGALEEENPSYAGFSSPSFAILKVVMNNHNDPPRPGDVTYFAESDYRNRNTKFGIKREDRTRHMYVIGKTGMGKTTLLENMAVQDIRNGNGIAFIDPHGEVADNLLDYVPEDRIKDVMYFAPFDLDYPISFNVMEDVGPDKRHLVADGLLSAFKKIWVDMWSGRMEYLLNNALLALLEYPDATILGVNRMFADPEYRKRVVANVSDVSVRTFWENEFAGYDQQFAAQAASAIQNKVGQFVSNPQVRNIVGQVKSSFDVRKLMDEKKIMIINLSKGQVGEDNARLIGSMLITKMYLAAMSRADTGGKESLANLPQFYFYVDEFQSFANESFAGILSEARKYKLNLTIAHQYIEQMTEDVRNAVFGNVGTMVTFRVGAFDAEVLEKEFAPTFEAEDLVNLGFAQIYLKLMIDGVSSQPFSARTLPPIDINKESYREQIRTHSRKQYGRTREEVEAEIDKWHDSTYGIVDDQLAHDMAKMQREKRISEGKEPFKEPTPPKHELVKKYEVGQIIKGKVANVVDFGIFIEIEDGLEGLAHISELAAGHIDDPNDLFKTGEEVTAKIIDVDKDDAKVSLSIKALEDKGEKKKEKVEHAEQAKSSSVRAPAGSKVESKKEKDSEVEETKKKEEKKENKKEKVERTKETSDTPPRKATEAQESRSSGGDSEPKNKDLKNTSEEQEKEKSKKPKPKTEAADPEQKEPEKAASLADLKAENTKKDEKGPSVANKSKLQAALAKVGLGSKDKTDSKSSHSKRDDQASEQTAEDKAASEPELVKKEDRPTTKDSDSDDPVEIPEDKLRQMLSVDKDGTDGAGE